MGPYGGHGGGGRAIGCLLWGLAILFIAWLLTAIVGFPVAVISVLLLIFLAVLLRD